MPIDYHNVLWFDIYIRLTNLTANTGFLFENLVEKQYISHIDIDMTPVNAKFFYNKTGGKINDTLVYT